MVDLARLADDEALRMRFGSATLERAHDYVRRGMVLTVEHEIDSDGDLDINGSVAGSTSAAYAVAVSVGDEGDGLWFSGRCSCPVREGCKHCVALILTVRAQQERDGPDEGGHRWERQLSSLLDELDDAAAPGTTKKVKSLALLLDLKRPTGSGYRAWAARFTPQRGTLHLRPVQRGARDNWVRTGISWQQLSYLDGRRGYEPDQVTVKTGIE